MEMTGEEMGNETVPVDMVRVREAVRTCNQEIDFKNYFDTLNKITIFLANFFEK